MRNFSILMFLAASVACGRPADPADVKMIGVGNNPDEIGPVPEAFGGLVEYDHMDIAGGALSIGAFGFLSYDEVNPAFMGFAPPYVLITGLAFVFEDQVAAPDVHHGSVGIPPEIPDTCWTTKDAMAFLGARTADVGNNVTLESIETEMGSPVGAFPLDRIPEEYPPDMQDVFVYYQGISGWIAEPLTRLDRGDSNLPEDMVEVVARPSNYVPGTTVSFRFPGGISPIEAPVSSIPLPSSPDAETLTLPALPGDIMMSWSGPLWDSRGNQLAESGEQSVCMRYLSGVTPVGLADCVDEPVMSSTVGNPAGQVYTAPWDTDGGAADGEVTFHWNPGEAGDGQMVLNVRFLGKVDTENENFVVERVGVDPENAPQSAHNKWDRAVEDGLAIGGLPSGYRDPLPCEDGEDITNVFDPSLGSVDENGDLVDHVPTLQGDPGLTVAEVSCLLEDDGEFVLNMSHLGEAWEYAQQREAGGSIFMLGRANSAEMTVPAVRDQQGNRRDITPIILRSHAMKIGRFWFDN
jgi:hypothetical protein